MCGIIGELSRREWDADNIMPMLQSIRHRGPDGAGAFHRNGLMLGHTRLAIIDLQQRSDQPMERGRCALAFNGEIWNYKQLRNHLTHLGHTFATDSDTEVVAWLLHEYGNEGLPMMEGMFAIAWHDMESRKTTLARDRFGEIPLHVADHAYFGSSASVTFGSEHKAVAALSGAEIRWVEPGQLIEYEDRGGYWVGSESFFYEAPTDTWMWDRREGAMLLREELAKSVADRSMSDVPVCALVSGGVDSTIVLHELVKHYPDLVAYTAVLNTKSRDLLAARDACQAFGVRLVEVPVHPPADSADLQGIVDAIEMTHKAQVEIAWACDALAAQIHEDGFKVVFSGEGSDELWASYGFAYHALKHVYDGTDHDPEAFALYRKRLFLGQHRKNFARCNKIFMAHGIECRLPFLHTRVVELGLGMSLDCVMDRRPDGKPSRQKAVLYDAYADVLPPSIMDRPKVAFQDGMGLKDAIAARFPNAKELYKTMGKAYA